MENVRIAPNIYRGKIIPLRLLQLPNGKEFAEYGNTGHDSLYWRCGNRSDLVIEFYSNSNNFISLFIKEIAHEYPFFIGL
jgi:hypothetical protein